MISKNFFYLKKFSQYFEHKLEGKRIALWGGAFKANTDDVRFSPALNLTRALLDSGAKVHFYDPKAAQNFLREFEKQDNLISYDDMYLCLQDCDGLVIMTEWEQFKNPDFDKIKQELKRSVIFDGRNLYNAYELWKLGFNYHGVGLFTL